MKMSKLKKACGCSEIHAKCKTRERHTREDNGNNINIKEPTCF